MLIGYRDSDAPLFPSYVDGRGDYSLRECWRAVCADARLGKLLGHRRHSTTAGYAHVADAHLVEAAESVGNTIAKAMNFDTAPFQLSPKPNDESDYHLWLTPIKPLFIVENTRHG